MSARSPSVAGTFYPNRAEELRRTVDGMLSREPREKAWAVIVPHAGYVYSGRVAGAVYGRIDVPRDVVLLCFNHRGAGKSYAIWREGSWVTPLGAAPVNAELAVAIQKAFLQADFDETGHLGEHSGEVQVPFLQRVRPDVRIVPVALSVGLDERTFPELRAFGQALAGVPGEFLVVASTDLNHYEDQESTLRKDDAVIAAMEALDAEGLRQAIRERDVTMCGFAPVLATLAYARAKGASRARTVLHQTSGDVSKDYERVVGYVGMIIGAEN
jgi:AmmeMemoRadiSam system protein B